MEVFMELEVLRKKVSSFRTDGGKVRNVSDELLMEILMSWEQWTGPASGFYKALGVSRNGIASIIGKAKKLKREGFAYEEFKEIKVAETIPMSGSVDPCVGIEITWEKDKLIRFQQVDQLIDFLKKVA